MAYLVELGHRRIAFVMHADGRGDETRPECHRLLGFERAMSKHGLNSEAMIADSRWSLDGGRDVVRNLTRLVAPPTAVYAGPGMMSVL